MRFKYSLMFILFTAIVMSSIVGISQSRCLDSPIFLPTEFYEQDPELFLSNASISIDSNETISLMNGLDTSHIYHIDSWSKRTFDSKIQLLRLVSCIHNFPSFGEYSKGVITTYNFDNDIDALGGNKLVFIEISYLNGIYYFIQTQEGMYQFFLSYDFINVSSTTLINSEQIDKFEFVTQLDTTASYEILSEGIVFDTITEELMYKAAGDSLVIFPAQFIDTFKIITQEHSTCDDAIIVIKDMEYIIEDSYNELDIANQSIYEIVTEECLSVPGYSSFDVYERFPFDINMLPVSIDWNFSFNSIDTLCKGVHFLDCINYSIDTSIIYDTVNYQNVYETCKSGYTNINQYCVDEYIEVPPIYETRDYEKLVAPPIYTQTAIPAQYITIKQYFIENKADLDSSCVYIEYDTILYTRLTVPSYTENINVPAKYETRQYYRINENDNVINTIKYGTEQMESYYINSNGYHIDKSSMRIPVPFNNCLKKGIAESLYQKGYLSVTNTDDESFYKAITEYQFEHNIPIGNITKSFLNQLNKE